MTFLRLAFFFGVLFSCILVQTRWITPLNAQAQALSEEISALKDKIQSDWAVVEEAKKVEKDSATVERGLGTSGDGNSDDNALIWLPREVIKHLNDFELSGPTVRLNAAKSDESLPIGYQQCYWGIGVPLANKGRAVKQVLLAAASLEERGLGIKVNDMVIAPDVEDPARLAASINIEAIVQK